MAFYLNNWEIWHTYSTYICGNIADLNSVAMDFVASGFAECSMTKEGVTYWKAKDGIGTGLTEWDMEPGSQGGRFTITNFVDKDPKFTDYSREMWLIATKFKHSEIQLFLEEYPLPAPYIRAFLGPCLLINENEHEVRCYPVVTLYESGVLLVTFRIIAPGEPIVLEAFIDKYVNLFRHKFDQAFVPPAIGSLATRAYYAYALEGLRLFNRLKLDHAQKIHDEHIEKIKREEVESGLKVEYVPLSQGNSDDKECTLSLAQSIFSIVGHLASAQNHGLKLLLFGLGKQIPMGGYWSGKPHIYIIEHSDQQEKASENEAMHRQSYGWILARMISDAGESSEQYLPKSARQFEDYHAYITSCASLWVWSKHGIQREKPHEDPNFGHLIYGQQAIIDTLESGYMLHRALADRIQGIESASEVLQARKNISELKLRMLEAGFSGEIRDLLNNGWQAMGLDSLREHIGEKLSILETETQLKDSSKTDRINRALTILFGVIAVPSLADAVTKPIWELFHLWKPQNNYGAQLYLIAISSLIVCTAIWLVRKGINIGRKEKIF